ncbi:hypothetical protein ACP43V_12145 [Vibrio genomosp. F10 str. 9ZC157]|uniref:Uncharacterized protein n=1 Tax=Vibrio genomosp. F10 TaxID=723171 RepID=A0A1B9R1H3_9VIBR|nr:hypothetical protein [Vibrio genomosp. F10]OCH78052.1 hypothetical protein A6E14_06370 [Vibrio genomosp. F10]OEE94507.1 hypothetical protein A1QM_18585 [Vibrio genomosp. F10 str. 9ZC157]
MITVTYLLDSCWVLSLGILESTRNEVGCITFEHHESECLKYISLYKEWSNKARLEDQDIEYGIIQSGHEPVAKNYQQRPAGL